jgi:hypothetical protein
VFIYDQDESLKCYTVLPNPIQKGMNRVNNTIGNFVIQQELIRGGEGTLLLANDINTNEQVCCLFGVFFFFFCDRFPINLSSQKKKNSMLGCNEKKTL